ncbi:MAG: hypothetical protein ACRDN0_27480, partial [Trebonia sp.]
MSQDAERLIRDWRAAEIFVPRPLPSPDVRENVIDVSAGNPLPWEPGGRLAGRSAGPGKVWRHQVFGGLFALSRVDFALSRVAGGFPRQGGVSGQSALFYCVVGESGALIAGPAVSECAWAAGQLALGDEAVGDGDPAAWLTASSRDGCLRVSPENLPAFPDGPPTAPDLARFAAELGDLLGVTALLEAAGMRVRSYQVPAYPGLDPGADTDAGDPPLSGFFSADLASVAAALRDSAGPALTVFLAEPEAEPEEAARVDVRREPLVVRDGCDPDRTPAARWPAAAPLVLSERFAVNEILAAQASPLPAVDTTPGGHATAVFSDVIAAIITERARVLASLPSPESGFGNGLPRGSPAVIPPAPALTGFEILMAASSARVASLAAIGDAWLDQAAATDYFSSTARLAGGTETWAMIRAHLGDAEASRAFIDRFWHGTVHGADALFRAGLPMREALGDSPVTAWPAAVARFRSALAWV